MIFFTIFFLILVSKYETIAKNILPEEALANENDELVSVAVLYRHGDRGPIGSYPNDPYHDIAYWPDGFGQLTNKGKTRHFELGKWLRNRYNNFLSENYSSKDILVLSSDVDRCLMSAQTNLAGLYTPTGSSIWLDDFLWEPIPIQAPPPEDDTFLYMSKPCPKFQKLHDEVNNFTFFKNLLVQYEDLIQYISQKTTWTITNLDLISELWQVFYIYRNYNESFIPSWGYSIDPSNFSYLTGVGYTRESFTPELKRLKTGPFFNYLINFFQNVLNVGAPKFLMLSAHDGTVANVLNSMGAYDFMPPEFAATVIWELYKDSYEEYYINIFYKVPSVIGLQQIILDGCKLNCSFNSFEGILSNIAVDDVTWENECNSQ